MKDVPLQTLNDLVERGVIQLTRGKIISKKDIDACPGNYPIYSSAKENDGKFGEYGKFLFDEELITWSVDGGGRLFHRPKHRFSVTNVGGVLRILDKSIFEYRYLYYALTLRHSEISFNWVKKAHPSVIRRLYTNIPIPSLSEQRRTVALLDEAFEALATTKANAEQNLQNASALFESQLESVFSQRGEEWEESSLKSITTKIGSGATPRGGEQSYKAKGISLIRSLNVHDLAFRYSKLAFLDDAQANELSTVEVQARDVLLNITGASVARCTIVPDDVLPARVNQHISIIRPDPARLDSNYLHYLLISRPHKDKLLRTGEEGGSTRQAITKAQIEAYRIAYHASLKKQEDIVAKLDAMLGETQRLTSIYERKLSALEELKTSLLHQAFNGDL